MSQNNLTLIQNRLIYDLDRLYEKILEHDSNNNEKAIMGLLAHIKEKIIFGNDFFEYWLIKFLNSPSKIGFFYLDEPNYHILGFDAKTIGPVLSSYIIFLEDHFYNDELIELIEHALNNKCIFEGVFFNRFPKELVSVDVCKKFKEKNSKNLEIYFNKNLDYKNNIDAVKI